MRNICMRQTVYWSPCNRDYIGRSYTQYTQYVLYEIDWHNIWTQRSVTVVVNMHACE